MKWTPGTATAWNSLSDAGKDGVPRFGHVDGLLVRGMIFVGIIETALLR